MNIPINPINENVLNTMPKRRRSRQRIYIVMGILVLAMVAAIGYRRHQHSALRYRLPKRSQQLAPAGVAEQQMLQGKFSQDVPAEQQQVITSEMHAADEPEATPPDQLQHPMRPGEQHVVLTQPLGTTVEDLQPTLTWDASLDGWSYRVRVEDQNLHRTVAASPLLNEALWRISTPLLRGHAYLWKVEAIPAGIRTTAAPTTSSTAQFSILSEENEQQIQSARAQHASHLLLGSLYTRDQMWREAVLEYRKMVDEVPDSPQAIKLLRNAEMRASSKLATESGH